MSHELICTWLGLAPGEWPPDHYRLLGLKPGESDPQLIEQHVHQRLDALRCYQVRHPEQATEALNRLAQAFVCLTEPAAKERYDADLLGRPAPPPIRHAKPLTMQAMPALAVLDAPGARPTAGVRRRTSPSRRRCRPPRYPLPSRR